MHHWHDVASLAFPSTTSASVSKPILLIATGRERPGLQPNAASRYDAGIMNAWRLSYEPQQISATRSRSPMLGVKHVRS